MPLISLQSFKALGILTGVALIMRVLSFFPSVIDHDESTYILIGEALLQGDIYWRDVIDTKPIGIFGVYAILQLLFGKSIFILRLAATLWIALTAWMLYHVHGHLNGQTTERHLDFAPLASGLIYIFMTSVFTFFGLSPNTEIFFTLFTIIALFIILRHDGYLWLFAAGVLLGIGFMIKYVVLFDALALGFIYLLEKLLRRKPWTYWLWRCAVMALGFLIPFSLTWYYYNSIGMAKEFDFFTFQLSAAYFVDVNWQLNLLYVIDCLARFFPVTLWFFYCTWHWRTTGIEMPVLSWAWGAAVLVIILLPGKLFYHYFIQMMLPLSLLAGSFFDHRRHPKRWLAWMRKSSIGYPLLIVGMLVILYFQKKDFIDKRDYPKEVAEWLKPRLQEGDKIYTGNYHQIIYFLTGTQSPTPYVHSSLIWDEKNNTALGIDRAETCAKILDQNPRFVLMSKKLPADNPMLETLSNKYHLPVFFEKEVYIYERK